MNNISNQPSFGSRFAWDGHLMAEKVSKNMSENNFNIFRDFVPDLKKVGGDEFTHIALPHPDLVEAEFKGELVDNPMSYYMQTVLKKDDGGVLQITRRPFLSMKNAQEHVDALLVAAKHGFSQAQLDKFETPEDIVRYGKSLDLEA